MKILQTNKSDFNQIRLIDVPVPAVNEGEIAVSIERFSFTANNITYAVAGDFLRYWSFFPAQDEQGNDVSAQWGQIPVWGFARVTESRNPDISVGERFFGYYPPTSVAVMAPTSVRHGTFVDGAAHRSKLPAGYNLYRQAPAESDPLADNEQSMLYPLFATAYSILDLCKEKAWFNSDQVLVLSASSKTSIGVAYAMNTQGDCPKSIGLTSKRNEKAISELNLYDEVLSYNDVAKLNQDVSTCMIDMSGNKKLLAELHRHFGDNMFCTLSVGATHWNELNKIDGLIDERTHQFFAPSQIESMITRMGPQQFQLESGKFISESCLKTRDWLSCQELSSLEELVNVYPEVCQGTLDANTGIMVVLN